jgi:hypothetical protein
MANMTLLKSETFKKEIFKVKAGNMITNDLGRVIRRKRA